MAETILACAESPRRDVKVGGAAKMLTTLETFAPRLADRVKLATSFSGQQTDRPAHADSTLYTPHPGDGRTRGDYAGHVMRSSAYTSASLHPLLTVLAATALGAGVALAARARDR